MKSRLLGTIGVLATLTIIISYLAVSNMGRSSAAYHRPVDDRLKEIGREVIERNKKLQEEQSAVPPDPTITDDVALGLVLRFISGNQTEQQKAQVRRYMSDILGVKHRADQDKLFAIGENYKLQSNQIQIRSEATTLKYHPAHNTITNSDKQTLRRLAADKVNLVRSSKDSLRHELSNAAWASLGRSLTTRVKPRIKASYHQ